MNITTITDILDEIKEYIERQEFTKKYFKSNGNSNGFEKLFDEDVISHTYLFIGWLQSIF